MKKRIQRIGCALALAASLFLAGCAHPDLIALQTPEAELVRQLGEPDARVPLPDGATRFVYSMQPMSQQVWWIIVDAGGKVIAKENILDREHFALIKPGVSTESDVYAILGGCAQKYEFALKNEHAWMYRFLDDGFFYMACWVQFDANGVVTEVGYTTDPWHDRDGRWW